MEILIAAGHVPTPSARHAAAKTSFYLCEYFARKHRLHLLTFATREGLVGFRDEDLSLFASWKIIPVRNRDRLRGVLTAMGLPLAIAARNSPKYKTELYKVIAGQHFDVVLLDHTAMFQYADDLLGTMVVGGNAHDIVTQNWARRAASSGNFVAKRLLRAEANRMCKWERKIFGKLDFVLVPSEKDRDLLLNLQPKATTIVIDPWVTPTGGNDAIAVESGALLYWGAMNRPENVDAARWAAKEILPRIRRCVPSAKLYIAGNQGEALADEFSGRDDIVITGFVKDVAGLMARMNVALLPLRQGAGIKLKTLECMTAGLPVVTTPVGEEGIGGTCGVHYFVSENAERLAADAVRLLLNPPEARKMGECARRFMEQRQDFTGRLAEVERFLEARVAQANTQRGRDRELSGNTVRS